MKKSALIIVLFSFIFASQAFADDVVVVELFTSQGCEKCPPANMLMEDLSRDKTVVSLSWHVDYWDFMGWQDTMAKPAFTERQKAYNEALGRKGVYTPQAIINGRRQVAGSNKMDLYEIIHNSKASDEMPVTVIFEGDLSSLKIKMNGPETAEGAVIKIIWLESLQRIKISDGKNAGKTITYVNVVKNVKNIGVFQGEDLTIPLELNDADRNGADRIVVLLQMGETGPILGAAKIDLERLPAN